MKFESFDKSDAIMCVIKCFPFCILYVMLSALLPNTASGFFYSQDESTPYETKPYTFWDLSSSYAEWMSEVWKDENDAAFVNIRKRINAAIAKKADVEQLNSSYKRIANQRPSDPKAQYQWAYVCFSLFLSGSVSVDLQECAAAMGRTTPANAYEYSRLRFLIESYGPNIYLLSPITRRLVEEKYDYQVLSRSVYVLTSTADMTDRDTAVKYADSLVKVSPKRPDAIQAKAWAYMIRWFAKHNVADARVSVSEYKRLREVFPDGSSEEKRINAIIVSLGKQIATVVKANKEK